MICLTHFNWSNGIHKSYFDYFQVKADVTEGSAKLADAIGGDSDAVICATGFQPSLNLLTPWKVGARSRVFEVL